MVALALQHVIRQCFIGTVAVIFGRFLDKLFMNRFKEIIRQSGLLFLGLAGAMWVGLLIADGLLMMILMLSFTISPFVSRMCRIVGYITVLSITMTICSSRISFKKKSFCVWETVVSAGLACIYQMLVAPIFNFAMYISGAAWYLGEIFCGGANTPIGQVGYAPARCYVWGMLICDVFYIVAIVIGAYIGYRKRQIFAKKLTENKS